MKMVAWYHVTCVAWRDGMHHFIYAHFHVERLNEGSFWFRSPIWLPTTLTPTVLAKFIISHLSGIQYHYHDASNEVNIISAVQ